MTENNLPNKVLAGRTALITGAGQGIGLGIAQAFAAAGARVVLAVRRREIGDAALDLIRSEGGDGRVVVADVTSAEQMNAAVEYAVAEFGGLDIAVHNANNPASAVPIALEAVTDADWEAQAAVAHVGAFLLAKAAHPYLKASGNGCYILLVSAFGLHGAGMNPIYSILKGADRGFIKALAREWGRDGIRVLGVAPSALTPPAELFFNQYPEIRAAYLTNFPLGRMGHSTDDIGTAVTALCSDLCRYVTGQTLVVDGGLFTA
ncbi:tropine dehydrogenase (plasmid) [Azospirillum sp. B510]|uniref:SDR family NAD(P)-dependent oxidoreductase n=1 Tax=Azospirillum sp. (strain B510) TaxID=137722 RepID=UPI0001C4CB15|nr:SDR family oxidoreductase [Azospirillum sp. B510]BAI74804.1 tropine dehydrogenase [Azospirillum sp. B510]